MAGNHLETIFRVVVILRKKSFLASKFFYLDFRKVQKKDKYIEEEMMKVFAYLQHPKMITDLLLRVWALYICWLWQIFIHAVLHCLLLHLLRFKLDVVGKWNRIIFCSFTAFKKCSTSQGDILCNFSSHLRSLLWC